ncbi:hypothetical protein AVO42_00815 [Thiomicrospira sp. XS5]|uniref:DUF1538 domain-containing protein n=1 Tax=Thiomicrospira sp. XS5 TaxID=1775636 RepID=UPI000747FF78|nr:DUF1538 domain-containing protein [Thiomicrospira sp. XS5]KUJ73994.1 hypothetical protein AVO42_00815 [Thiomicrospira sp. XS5]
MKKVSFHDIVQHERFNTKVITYNELTHSPEAAYQKFQIKPVDAYRLLRPYLQSKVFEQLKAVMPLTIYLALFQILILRQPVADASIILGGMLAVIFGLMFFMEGLRLGLMPFGEVIGNKLPQKSTLPVVLLIAFLLGIGVTFAEPAIGALKAAGANVDPKSAPYLYALLNHWPGMLVLVVGGGVGLAAVLGTLRFIYDWSLKPLIFLTVIPTLLITLYSMQHPELVHLIGLAWDSGAVTTGPVTVPLVLALGIGIASAAGSGNQSLSGFGIVTLASLFPIMGVQLLALYIHSTVSIAEIEALSHFMNKAPVFWYETTPYVEIIAGIRAIVPLVLFLGLVLVFLLRDRLQNAQVVMLGLAFSVVGMIIFNLGLTYGLAKLGGQAGEMIPGAFTGIESIKESPLYWFSMGIAITVLFAFALGFGATLAEPALNALGMTVERLTNGAFKKQTLMMAVSLGVGVGIAIGVSKIIFDWSLAWLLIPAYLFALVLTVLSSEEFVNVAWDSAGVTTGPVTVPLVLAMGLGLGQAVGVVEGFGILSMASIGPIITVLLTGLWIKLRCMRQEKAALKTAMDAKES